jgi:predicted O-methyltransferase YrrM
MIKGALEDKFLNEEFDKLIKKYNISTIVETGTYKGWSTNILAKKVNKVITIDVSEDFLNEAKKNNLQNKNIDFYQGSSSDILEKILVKNNDSILFFLDAHWGKYWPLHDELKIIKNKEIIPIIIIHDFYVPDKDGNAKFGYDKYDTKVLNFDYVRPSMEKIYGVDGYTHYCLNESEINAGCGIFTPKDN